MFNSLKGTLTGKEVDAIFLQTAGVEWLISVSATTSEALPDAGEEAHIFVHLHHREDQMVLYGFASMDERSLFMNLLKVTGIGPKQALRILSGMSVEEFVRNLDDDNIDALSRIPGLGKKTAQKIILALRDRLSIGREGGKAPNNEMVEALIEMGFDRQEAQVAVEKAITELNQENIEPDERERETLRRAIVFLSSG